MSKYSDRYGLWSATSFFLSGSDSICKLPAAHVGGGRRERGRDMEQERCPSLPLLAKLLSLTPTPTQIPVEVPLIGKALNQQTKALPTLIWCVSIALEQVGRGALLPFLLSPPPFPSSSPSPYCYNSFFRSPTFYHHLLQCLTLM